MKYINKIGLKYATFSASRKKIGYNEMRQIRARTFNVTERFSEFNEFDEFQLKYGRACTSGRRVMVQNDTGIPHF